MSKLPKVTPLQASLQQPPLSIGLDEVLSPEAWVASWQPNAQDFPRAPLSGRMATCRRCDQRFETVENDRLCPECRACWRPMLKDPQPTKPVVRQKRKGGWPKGKPRGPQSAEHKQKLAEARRARRQARQEKVS